MAIEAGVGSRDQTLLTNRFKAIGFALKRPWLFVRGLLVSRDRPNLARLAAIPDSERFVWAVLPHAARTLAPSIVALPYRRALVAAVGYLYARMLDTYEDLESDIEAKLAGLEDFAGRFAVTPLREASALKGPTVDDDRDRVHLLLVNRCALVDDVFAGFDADDKRRIIDMIMAMSEGMRSSSALFEQQGGVLESARQIEDYCHTVIGHPISFTMQLVVGEGPALEYRDDAMDLSVLIQLANVTRDIEKDLQRGVAYHPVLRPFLADSRDTPAAQEAVASARAVLLVTALRHVPAYRRLIDDLDLPRFSLARGSAALMALFTDRHYRRTALRAGLEGWSGPKLTAAIWMVALPAIVSHRWTSRVLHRIENDSAAAIEASEIDPKSFS